MLYKILIITKLNNALKMPDSYWNLMDKDGKKLIYWIDINFNIVNFYIKKLFLNYYVNILIDSNYSIFILN